MQWPSGEPMDDDRFEPSPWDNQRGQDDSSPRGPERAGPPADSTDDTPFVRIVQSSNPAEIAFLHGLFEDSDIPYRVLGFDLSGGDGTFVAGRSESFLVPECDVEHARELLLDGIAEIPAMRQQILDVGEWSVESDSTDTPPGYIESDWTRAMSAALFAGLLVATLTLVFIYVLRSQ